MLNNRFEPEDKTIDILLQDVDADMVELTQEKFSKISTELWRRFGKNIQILLKQIEIQEKILKTRNAYSEKSSSQLASMLTKEVEDFKAFDALKRLMIKAYQIIHEFREYITKENIEYFIQVYTGKNTSKFAQLKLNELINYLSLSVDSSKNFRLSLVPKRAKEIETNKTINEFRNSLYDIQKIITTMRAAAGEKSNQGFVLEAALNIIADIGPQAKITSDIVEKYYQPGNLPGTRGGDINEEQTKKLIERGIIEINKKLQLQAKKVTGTYGAAVVSISNIKSELFNLSVLIRELTMGKVNKKTLKTYFTDSRRASDIAREIKNEVGMKAEESLSKVFEEIQKQNKHIKII